MTTGAENFEHSVLEKINGFLYRCKTDEFYTMLAMTSGIHRIFGYPVDELIGNKVRTYSSIIHPADRSMVDSIVNDSFAAKQNFDVDYRIVTADGRDVWVHETGGGVWSASGELLYCEGGVTDINNLYVRNEQRTSELQSVASRTSDILETLRTLRILSLNASIEAARAGESGGGFAVLAHEMRKLAATSEDMARAISRKSA